MHFYWTPFALIKTFAFYKVHVYIPMFIRDFYAFRFALLNDGIWCTKRVKSTDTGRPKIYGSTVIIAFDPLDTRNIPSKMVCTLNGKRSECFQELTPLRSLNKDKELVPL